MQFSLCCYFSFVVVVVVFLIFLNFWIPILPPHRLVLNSLCSPLFFRDEGVTEERRRYGQGRQGTGLLLRYRQEDERYGSLLYIPFCASLSLSRARNKRVRFAFSCSLFLCCWDGGTLSLSLSRIVYVLCLLSRFIYVAIDCRFLSPHRRYALVLSASLPFDKNMKSRSEEKESRGHARLSFFEYREQEKVK